MPPQTRGSAPANRVYKSSTPLQQSKLPVQKKRVKSYGKATGPRIQKVDNTLTQMDFVQMTPSFSDEEEDEEESLDLDLGLDNEELKKPGKSRRKTMAEESLSEAEPKRKRRKTMGDELATSRKSKRSGRKSTGGISNAIPQYHTQTITQITDWNSPAPDEEPEDDSEAGIYSGPYSSHSPKSRTKLRKSSKSTKGASPTKRDQSITGDMPRPQTPSRKIYREIPPSQSPATPISTHSQASARRFPLAEKSTNLPIPFSVTRKRQQSTQKPPILEIQDTFEISTDGSEQPHAFSSPKRPSPAKSVRFVIPEDNEEEEEEEEVAASPSVKKEYSQTSPGRKLLWQAVPIEIPDSDAESDEDPESLFTGDDLGSPMLNPTKTEPETQYGNIGLDTQLQAETLFGPSPTSLNPEAIPEAEPETELEVEGPESDLPENPKHIIESGCLESTAVDEEPARSKRGEWTQRLESQRMELNGGCGEEPASDITEYRTQTESQRLSTQYIHSMAPRTMESDIFISIPPQQVADILSRAKDHITRNWTIPPSVSRIWIYETAPISSLKYMASIGAAKRPGEISSEAGKGNAQFNTRTSGQWYAYEILQLYELADPLPLAKLAENEWLHAAPAKFIMVRPAVLGQLMANLQPPLFGPVSEQQDTPQQAGRSSSSSDTQEAREQLLSTMRQYTQHPEMLESVPSSHPPSDQASAEASPYIPGTEPSSPPDHPQPPLNILRPSQATTVDLTQPQTPREHSLTEIIWETPTRPVPSSKLPNPKREPDGRDCEGPQSLVPFSMNSSQLLTKSQMLPESLVSESIPAPPGFVLDSDAEDDDDEF